MVKQIQNDDIATVRNYENDRFRHQRDSVLRSPPNYPREGEYREVKKEERREDPRRSVKRQIKEEHSRHHPISRVHSQVRSPQEEMENRSKEETNTNSQDLNSNENGSQSQSSAPKEKLKDYDVYTDLLKDDLCSPLTADGLKKIEAGLTSVNKSLTEYSGKKGKRVAGDNSENIE